MDRRNFVQMVAGVATASAFTGIPFIADGKTTERLTIQQVIDMFLKEISGSPFPNTVDTIKAGDANRTVTGIVTTMFATVAVIEKAAKLGANFIIAHEPTFYSHTDDTSSLGDDPVYQYKKALLDKYQITVWRNHDYIHSYKPDGVFTAVQDALKWRSYSSTSSPYILNLPATTLGSIIEHCRTQLGLKHLRYIGNRNAKCSKIALMPGAAGGKRQINICTTEKPDLIIVGEASEWETPEYIRDAQSAGINMSLIVLGHIPSEQPGSKWMADWLKSRLKGITVNVIDPGQSMTWS